MKKGYDISKDRSTTNIQETITLYHGSKSKIYTLAADLSGLKILNIEVGLDWALLVAYNRGKMEQVKGSPIYEQYKNLSRDRDMIIGNIANDRMFVVLDRFFLAKSQILR